MANFLSAVGRAQPSRNVLDVIQGGISLDQNRRRNELTAAELAMSAEQLEQTKRQGEYQEQLRKEGETPLAIEAYANRFEGGAEGPMFKMVYDMADKAGYVDKSLGGLGTVKKRHMPEIGKLMADPNFAMKLSRTRIDYWRGQLNQVQTALAEKPTDKKLLEAREQATVGLQQAIGQDKAVADQIELDQKTELEKTKAENKAVMDVQEYKRKVAADEEKVRHNKKLERVAKALKPKQETTEEKEARTLRIHEAKLRIKAEFDAKNMPESYRPDLTEAFKALAQGADSKEVYFRMAAEYPDQAKNLEAIFFTPSQKETLEALIQIFGK